MKIKKLFLTLVVTAVLFLASFNSANAIELGFKDSDSDGIYDIYDNCPTIFNPLQEDNDGDGIGDACDNDDDNDYVPDNSDNCPFNFNPGQEDNDNDSIGDVCDNDDDNDGILDTMDNCPFQQEDFDGYQDNDGCFDGNVNPVANAGPDQSACSLTVQFNGANSYDLDGTIVSYNWDFGDGYGGTGVNPVHTYNNPGNYIALLMVTDNNGATNIDSVSININRDLIPTVQITATPSQGNEPLTVSFTSTVTGDSPFSYNWDFGDGGSSTVANPTHTFDNEGTYTVTLTVTDQSACGLVNTASATRTVTVNAAGSTSSPSASEIIEEHKLSIVKIVTANETIFAGDEIEFYVEIKNNGDFNERDIQLFVDSQELGISGIVTTFSLNKENSVIKVAKIKIPKNTKTGEYNIKFTVKNPNFTTSKYVMLDVNEEKQFELVGLATAAETIEVGKSSILEIIGLILGIMIIIVGITILAIKIKK